MTSIGDFRPEVFMLEGYYVKPSTIDRVRGSWLGPQIESYLEWLQAHGYPRPSGDFGLARRAPSLRRSLFENRDIGSENERG